MNSCEVFDNDGIVSRVFKTRGIRVLGVPWHTVHQYRLSKLSFIENYDILIEPWRQRFATEQRPFPPNMRYVADVVKGYYDIAILHIDQQSVYDPDKGDNISKGRLFLEAKEIIQKVDPDLPIVVINHMTPFHDKYATHVVIQKIKKMTEGCHMVCNSYEAGRQWGWGDVITHGYHPDEWGFDVDHFKKTGKLVEPEKDPRCLIVMSPAGMEKAYKREFARDVVRRLEEDGVPVEWIGVTRKQFKTYDDYRDYMAKTLLFFFPAWQSPRPGARTEAQLSGQCIVTTPYQDAADMYTTGYFKQKADDKGKITKEWIEYDENTTGFLTSPDPEKVLSDPRSIGNIKYTANMIRYLVMERPDIARQVGRQGRQAAIKTLNHDQFEKQWRSFLKKNNLIKVDGLI